MFFILFARCGAALAIYSINFTVYSTVLCSSAFKLPIAAYDDGCRIRAIEQDFIDEGRNTFGACRRYTELDIRITRGIIFSGGEGMQRTELVRKLRQKGWRIVGGSPHATAFHPSNPKFRIPIPHGSKINDRTAERILRDAGVK